MGYISKILGNSASALRAQQAAIANTSSNVANVNTPGYTRRVVQFETRAAANDSGGIQIGNGVSIASIQRVTDTYLEQLLQTAKGEAASSDVQNNFLDRIQGLFSLTADKQTIGSTLTDFFSSINDLSNNPSSLELRTNFLEKAQAVVDTLKNTYNKLGQMQDEIDQRLIAEVSTVNSITEQIASLNETISTKEISAGIGTAGDERDTRDVLLQQLSQKLSFQSTEESNGAIQIRLANGFTLVAGATSRQIDMTQNPSFLAGNGAPSISGGQLHALVYNYGDETTRNDFDLTEALKNGQGSIGGLLRTRGTNEAGDTSAFEAEGILPEAAARIEAISRALLTTFNAQYLGTQEDGSQADRSVDLDGVPPAVFGLFDFSYGGMKDRGALPNGLPQVSDLDDILANDPSVKNFTSLLMLATKDPRRVAAAIDESGTSTGVSQGDGRNLLGLGLLETSSISLSAGNYSATATLNGAYQQSVTYIGNLKSAANTAAKVSAENEITAQGKRDSFSAVNLDEEFTGLIGLQQAYQAAARLIRTASEMYDQLFNLL